MVNTSKVSATVGSARFEAEGPAEIVLTQYSQFLKSLRMSPASAPTGPVTLADTMMHRFFVVGAPTKPPSDLPPAVRFLNRFGPACA